MGSTRLPGKVLMRIQGHSILRRAIHRLQASPVVDEVVVLTTVKAEDDAVVEEAHMSGAMTYRGSESNVLERFQKASEAFHPDVIIRATADNPLIDIGSIERIVHTLQQEELDWCMENELPYGAATEALTGGALARVYRISEKPRHKEHVTLYIKDHPEEFRLAYLEAPDSLRYPQVRLTVDTAEDFAFMNTLISSKPEADQPIPLIEYIPLALCF
jgi:spore coat polysaccharide biosynthesis protein SpsF